MHSNLSGVCSSVSKHGCQSDLCFIRSKPRLENTAPRILCHPKCEPSPATQREATSLCFSYSHANLCLSDDNSSYLFCIDLIHLLMNWIIDCDRSLQSSILCPRHCTRTGPNLECLDVLAHFANISQSMNSQAKMCPPPMPEPEAAPSPGPSSSSKAPHTRKAIPVANNSAISEAPGAPAQEAGEPRVVTMTKIKIPVPPSAREFCCWH